jgi:hypothetical protein
MSAMMLRTWRTTKAANIVTVDLEAQRRLWRQMGVTFSLREERKGERGGRWEEGRERRSRRILFSTALSCWDLAVGVEYLLLSQHHMALPSNSSAVGTWSM